MPDWYGVGSAAINGASSIFGSLIGNKLAEKREAAAREENYKYGEMAADNADARTRALYKDLYGPEAQMQQIKNAGLSPSMFYGDMGGISGQAGAQGTGAAGISPNTFGVNPVDISMILRNNAEANLANANAQNVKAKTDAEVAKLLADAGHADAAAAAEKCKAEGLKLDNYLKENTLDANIYQVCELAEKSAHEATKMYHEMRNAKVLADINDELYNTNIEKGKQELENLISVYKLNEQQRQKLRNDVLKSFDEVAQGWKQLDIEERSQVSYSEWLDKRIPQIEKELQIKLEELGVKKTALYVNAIVDVLKSVCQTAVAVSMFSGRGGDLTPKPKDLNMKPKKGGNAINNGVPVYKNNTLWDY